MEKNDRKRLKPAVLQTDKACLKALQRVSGYAPINPTYNLKNLMESDGDMTDLQTTEEQALTAAATARRNAVAKEWEFHELMLGAKDQVVAQFGRNSDESQSLGLKKKSEYKPRTRKTS